jgi:hypothetical protein
MGSEELKPLESGQSRAHVGDRREPAAHIGFAKADSSLSKRRFQGEQLALALQSVEDEVGSMLSPRLIVQHIAAAEDQTCSCVCRLNRSLRPGKVAARKDVKTALGLGLVSAHNHLAMYIFKLSGGGSVWPEAPAELAQA